MPAGSGHNSRTVALGLDGRIYLSLGISGNCSDQYLGAGYLFDAQRGGVMVLQQQDGKASWQSYAAGLRNPVGFDWHPLTKNVGHALLVLPSARMVRSTSPAIVVPMGCFV